MARCGCSTNSRRSSAWFAIAEEGAQGKLAFFQSAAAVVWLNLERLPQIGEKSSHCHKYTFEISWRDEMCSFWKIFFWWYFTPAMVKDMAAAISS